jgi:S1-C subfamily serine protease
MRRVRLLGWIGCLFTAVAGWAGTIDEISRAVVFLSDNVPVVEELNGVRFEVWLKVPGTNAFIPKRSRVSGTGLIVGTSNLAYLVTAKHVAESMTAECELIMRGDKREPIHLKISSITAQSGLRWFHHTNADISVYPLPAYTPEGSRAMERRGAPVEWLEPATNLPSRDVYVTALGFPLGLGAEGEFVPLSRESKVSSGMLNDAKGLFFLLQDPSVSGYSGGPLIESGDRVLGGNQFGSISVRSGGCRCWGFVSGTYGDETGGKMSRITPALYAVELIRQAQRELKVVYAPIPPAEKK